MKRLIVLLFFICFVSYSAEISGYVYKVIDGDTFILKDGEDKFKVRMADIDAPELSQEFGEQARNYLADLINGKKVNVEFHQIDMYGRIVGTVYYVDEAKLNVEIINRNMVKDGYAWWYRQYSKELIYFELEKDARLNKRGIWKSINVIEPWIYRKVNKRKGNRIWQ